MKPQPGKSLSPKSLMWDNFTRLRVHHDFYTVYNGYIQGNEKGYWKINFVDHKSSEM